MKLNTKMLVWLDTLHRIATELWRRTLGSEAKVATLAWVKLALVYTVSGSKIQVRHAGYLTGTTPDRVWCMFYR